MWYADALCILLQELEPLQFGKKDEWAGIDHLLIRALLYTKIIAHDRQEWQYLDELMSQATVHW